MYWLFLPLLAPQYWFYTRSFQHMLLFCALVKSLDDGIFFLHSTLIISMSCMVLTFNKILLNISQVNYFEDAKTPFVNNPLWKWPFKNALWPKMGSCSFHYWPMFWDFSWPRTRTIIVMIITLILIECSVSDLDGLNSYNNAINQQDSVKLQTGSTCRAFSLFSFVDLRHLKF